MKLFIKIVAASLLLVCFACSENNKQNKPTYKKATKNDLVLANKILVENDNQLIESFIKRRNWAMTKSDIGIWIEKTVTTHDSDIRTGSTVSFSYVLELLDGTRIEEKSESNPEIIIIGEGKVVKGLDYALRQLKNNETARVIIPPQLGYGLLGNQKNIPPRAILYYQIKILSVN